MLEAKTPRETLATLHVVAERRRAPENLPDSPGVYLFRGDKGKLLYVGKARSLRKRVASYFGAGGRRTPRPSAFAAPSGTSRRSSPTPSSRPSSSRTPSSRSTGPGTTSASATTRPIPTSRSRRGRPGRAPSSPGGSSEDGHSYFGPFWGGLARRIMRMITRHFQIRTCTLEIDGKLPRPCLYYDLHACLGPCVAGLTTRRPTARRSADVVLFLEGRNRELRGEPGAEDAGRLRGAELRDGGRLPRRAPHGARRRRAPGRAVA